MEQLHLIAGLPRAGSTLLCQILDSNPDFHVTPTSGILDMIKTMRTNFSQNPTWRAQHRLDIYENMRMGMKGFVEGYYYDRKIVFDKNRAWPCHLNILDAIMQDDRTKIIWLYRNPAEIVSSIEAQHNKTLLLENMDEAAAPSAFMTLDRRISTYVNPDGLISFPVEALKDALEMGYSHRIFIVKYYDLTNNTEEVLNQIHDFLKLPRYEYDLKNIKQRTFEFDGVYNYKFPHVIREGEIKYKTGDYQIEEKFVNAINERFAPLNKLILTGDHTALLNLPPLEAQQVQPPVNEPEKVELEKVNPFEL